MTIKPRHILLMAAKYEFMSQRIKTGSFVCFNISKFKCKTEFDGGHDQHDKCSTSMNKTQNIGVTVDKPFVCGTCHKGFPWKCRLEIHQRIHTGDKPYTCDRCEKGFT